VVPFFLGQYAAGKNPKKDGHKINLTNGQQFYLTLKGTSRVAYITFSFIESNSEFTQDRFEVNRAYFVPSTERVLDDGTVTLTVDEARREWNNWVNRGYKKVDELPAPKKDDWPPFPETYRSKNQTSNYALEA